MSLKLIREATLVATLDEAELKALVAMKTGSRLQEADEKMQLWTADSGNYDVHHPERHKSIGYFKTEVEARTALDKCPNKKMMGPIHKVAGYASWLKKNVTESFTPSDSDFDAWMRVVVGEAGDRGVNLNKKSEFMQLTLDVLENDPASPPFDMQEMIASKLWQDYNSAKNAVRINKLAQAKEEEEKVATARKQIATRYAQGPSTVVTTNPSAFDEEEMGISDDLAARKIFNKIKGTPNLNFMIVQQYVNKYIGMVGKSPTDVKYISALVYSMVQDAGMAEEDEEVEDFLRRGEKIQHIPPRKARKSEKWQGSAHIGRTGERPGHSTTGNAANSLGRPVIGLSNTSKEEEESGFAQALRSTVGMEEEGDDEPRLAYGKRDWGAEAEQYPGDGYRAHRAAGGELSQDDWDFDQSQKNPWDDDSEEEWYDERGRPDPDGAYDAGGHLDMERLANNGDEDYLKDQAFDSSFEDEEPSFVRDALRDRPSTSMKGSFSSHLRGEDEFDDEGDDTEVSFGPDGVEGVSDDEVFTSDDDARECPCDDEFGDTDEFDKEPTDDELDDIDTSEEDFDDEPMDDVDADVEPRAPKKGFDEEEAVKSFFRQAVTSPNDMMRQAVKDIEEEGKNAWRGANVPKNPHPQKSQAFRAWQKGLMNAAKEALGIVDKPAAPKAKPKRKK